MWPNLALALEYYSIIFAPTQSIKISPTAWITPPGLIFFRMRRALAKITMNSFTWARKKMLRRLRVPQKRVIARDDILPVDENCVHVFQFDDPRLNHWFLEDLRKKIEFQLVNSLFGIVNNYFVDDRHVLHVSFFRTNQFLDNNLALFLSRRQFGKGCGIGLSRCCP